MLLLELAHVEAGHAVLVAEEQLRERLGQFGLAHTGGPEEEEGTDGAVGVAHSGPVAAHRLRDRGDRLVLTDHSGVQRVLQLEELLLLAGGELRDRDTGAAGDDFGDVGGGDVHDALALFLDTGEFGLRLRDLELQPGRLLEVLGRHRFVLLPLQLGELVLAGDDLGGPAERPQPHPGARLVHEVDGLVRQEAVADVAVGQFGRCHQCVVGEADLVVGLVGVPQALQDLDGLLDRRLGHHDGLETALQRGVLLDVLAVLVDGRRADDVQFTAGQRRFEHVAGVHGALAGRSGADHGVQLVDEQDRRVRGGADLVDDVLEPFLELAAVLGARHQAGEVQGDHPLVLEGAGDVPGHDALGDSLHDRGLADAGLTDQHGVVLGAPRENLHGLLDLLGPADHGIEFPGLRLLGQVASVLVERRGVARSARRGAVGPCRVVRLAPQFAGVRAVGTEQLGRTGLLGVQQRAEDVLGPDVGDPGRLRTLVGMQQYALGGRRQPRFRGRRGALARQDFRDPFAQLVGDRPGLFEQGARRIHLGGGPQQVFGVQVPAAVLGRAGGRPAYQLTGGFGQQPPDGNPLHLWR